MRARQTFLFVVKRAIYDVLTKWKGKQRNRDWFRLKEKQEREEDSENWKPYMLISGFCLAGKKEQHNYYLPLGVHSLTTSREAAARQTPSVCVKGR